jgi:PAS domain S-box-containing protein
MEDRTGGHHSSVHAQPPDRQRRAPTARAGSLAAARAQLASLRTHASWWQVWRVVRPVVAFAVAYTAAWSYLFVAAFLGAKPPPAPLFPPGAVLLCALVLAPTRRWWLYLVAAFVIQVPILAYLHLPLGWNLLGFTPDAIEPLIAVSLLRRFIRVPPRLAGLRGVSLYTACVVVGVGVAATVGAALNAKIGGEPYWSSWRSWFLSDALAGLVLAPTLLLWLAAGVQGLRTESRWRSAEAGVVYGGLVLLGVLVFNTHLFGPQIAHAEIYLPVPLLLWAAVRFGPRGIATALSLLVVLAIPAVANATGPFASQSVPARSVLASVFDLQMFLLVIGVPLFFLAAVVEERKRVDAALQASEARYRGMVESQTELISRYLPDTTLTFVNEANCRALGKSRKQLLGTKFIDLLPDTERERVRTMVQSLLTHPGVSTIEHQVRMADGSLRWQQWVDRTILDQHGRVVELQGIGRDTTERKQLEQEREAARAEAEQEAAQLEATFDAIADGVVVFDHAGHVVRQNAAQRQLVGEDAAPPGYAAMSLPERLALFAARDTQGRPLRPDEGPVPRALRGEVVSGAETMDLLSRTLDGREIELSVSAAPLRNQDGQVTGAVATFRDQTERNWLERNNADQAAQLDRIFEGITDGLVVYNAQGQVVRSNAAARRVLGLDDAPNGYAEMGAPDRAVLYEAFDEQGRRLAPEDWPLIRVLRGHAGTGADGRDIRLRALTGRAVDLHTSAAPLHDGEGRLVGAVSILHDLTERKRAEERLRHLQEVTAHLAAALTLAEVRQVLRGDLVAAVGARGADLLLMSGDELKLDEEALDTPLEDAVRRRAAAVALTARYPAAEAARTGEAIFLRSAEELIQRYPVQQEAIPEAAPEAVAYLPLRRGEDVFGVLSLRFPAAHMWEAPERSFVQALADRAAVAYERARLFEAEREARRQLEAVLEVLPAGVAIADAQGKFLHVNPAFRDAWGEHALPQRMAEYDTFDGWHPDGTPMQREDWPMVRALSREETVRACEIEIQAADGVRRTILSNAAPLRDTAGRVTGGVVAFLDITQRKHLEQEREAAIAHLEALQAIADTALTHLGLDELLRSVLDRIHAVLGLENSAIRLLDAEGRTLGLPTAHMQDVPALAVPLELGQGFAGRIAASREPLVVDDLTDFPFVNRALGAKLRSAVGVPLLLDGRLLGVLYSGSTTPRHFTHHEVRLLQVLAERVAIAVERAQLYETERQARARAAARTAELEAVFGAMTDGVVVYDRTGRATYVNPALRAMFAGHIPPNYESLSLPERAALTPLRTPAGDVVPEDQLPHARLLRGEVLAGAASPDLLFAVQDGRAFTVQYRGSPLRDETGSVTGAVMVLRNVTDERRLKHELAEQAAQLDRIFEGIADGLVVYDSAGQVVRTNPAIRRLLIGDVAPDGPIPPPVAERRPRFVPRDAHGHPLAPEERPLVRLLREEGITGAIEQDIRLRALDGRTVEVATSTAPLRDGEGRLLGAVSILHDQTERKRLEREREEALARAQARSAELEAVFGAMTDGVVVYDPTGHITYLNAAVRTLFALDARPDFAHLALAERATLTRPRTPMGQMLPVDQLPQTRVLRGEVIAPSGDVATTDLVEEALDGRVLTLQVAGSPLRDAAGNITGAVLVFRDVTVERQLHSATRVLAVQLQATLDAMSDAVFLYGTDGQVLRLNAAAQALVDAEPDLSSVDGRTWWGRVQRHAPRLPDGRPLSRREWPLARVLRGETLTGATVQEVVLTDAQGHEQVLSYVGGPARDAVGKLMGYVFMVRDVTERRRLEREREQAEARELAAQEVTQQLDQFLAMASHDIRTPVTSLSGNLELARLFVTRLASRLEAHDSPEGRAARQLATVIERADESSTRLSRLVVLLFDMTRARLGTLTVTQAPLDLVAFVREQVAVLQDTVPERTIEVDLPSAAVVVEADADRLGQVLTNYLTNALKYSAAGQPVAVRLEVRGGRAVVSVRDHGPGLPEEEQRRVWDLYYRAPGVSEQSSIGVASGSLGMGLFVCKQLVEAHPGGQVGVDSLVGEGSTFWFSVPFTSQSSDTE